MADAKIHSRADAPKTHEQADPKLAPILRFAAILALFSLVTFYAMYRMFASEMSERSASDAPLPPLAERRQIPPEPRLQSLPGVQLPETSTSAPMIGESLPSGVQPFMSASFPEFDRRQRDELSSYGWIDRQAGIVHIPIDAAMELVLKKGLPSAKTEKR